MKLFKQFIFIMFAFTTALCVISCEDDKEEKNACAQEIALVEHATGMECTEAEGWFVTTCEESFTVSEDKKACNKVQEDVKQECTCDSVCAEDEECKCAVDKKECVKKEVVADKEDVTCNPVCSDTQECKCENEKCECVDKAAEEIVVKNLCKDKKENDVCEENKTCQVENEQLVCKETAAVEESVCNPVCSDTQECKCENEKCECVDKVVEEMSPEDMCSDKQEGDVCGENKTCQHVIDSNNIVCLEVVNK